MKTAFKVVPIVFCIVLVGCDYFEARRVVSQSENELGIHFLDSPAMLQSESYGWAEEGGDRALLRLSAADCTQVSSRLKEIGPVGIDSSRMFAVAGIEPTRVRRKFEMNQHGDTRQYELDEASCVLFRDAYFE